MKREKYSGEKGVKQMTEHPVSVKERSGRADHFKWSTDNSQMLTVEYQAEGRNFDTEFMLTHEFKRNAE